ncbi:MAG: septum formation initiator family protein [Bryobacterales bacterium]|nr:septum formation initiator family protein [Bryobacterales bacterium]
MPSGRPPRRRLRDRNSAASGRAAPERKHISPWAIWLYGLPIVGIGLALMHMVGFGPFYEFQKTLSAEAQLEEQIDELERENAALQREIEELGHGGIGVERRARELLGWSRAGEVVIHLPEKR